jgi:hypothetical protein
MALVGSLLLASCLLPTLAPAAVREANALNSKRGEHGSPSQPVLDGLKARYDDVAGDITLTLTFFEPLADLSELSGWEATVYLADNVGTDQGGLCVPLLSRNNFLFSIKLGDGPPAQGIEWTVANYNFNWTISPDRKSIRLRGADPRLANLKLVCAHADLTGPTNEYSFIGAQLFSGYGPFDGNIATTARWSLAYEMTLLNNALGNARRDPPLDVFPRCHRTSRDRLKCRGRSKLRDVKGKPTVALDGRMRLSYSRSFRTRWRRDIRVSLHWKRCPESVRPGRAGRRCTVTKRWRRGSLARLFRSVGAARNAGAARSAGAAAHPGLRLGEALRPLFRQSLDTESLRQH